MQRRWLASKPRVSNTVVLQQPQAIEAQDSTSCFPGKYQLGFPFLEEATQIRDQKPPQKIYIVRMMTVTKYQRCVSWNQMRFMKTALKRQKDFLSSESLEKLVFCCFQILDKYKSGRVSESQSIPHAQTCTHAYTHTCMSIRVLVHVQTPTFPGRILAIRKLLVAERP